MALGACGISGRGGRLDVVHLHAHVHARTPGPLQDGQAGIRVATGVQGGGGVGQEGGADQENERRHAGARE